MPRVLNYLQVSNRYGRVGDFAAWATLLWTYGLDSSSEVVKAFEFKNFGVFGALLITVVGGNFENGFTKVYNITAIKDHIDKVAPPIIYTKLQDVVNVKLDMEVKSFTGKVGRDCRDYSYNKTL